MSDQQEIPRLLYKKRRLIIGVTILAALCCAVFSMPYFIPPHYKSEVVLYPPGTNSNKVLIEKDTRFGSDKEIDEQIQLLRSTILRDSIARKYKLAEHYDIDTTQKKNIYRLYKEYEQNILIDRTRYGAIAVIVYDTDPIVAAGIANDMVRMCDEVKADMIRKNLHAALTYLETDYQKKLHEFDDMAEKINLLLKGNHVDMNLKKQNFVERMKQEIDIRKEMAKNVNTSNNYNLKGQYNYESIISQLVELQFSYEAASSNLNNNIPTCYVVSPAQPSYQKSYPVRWLIVLIGTLAAFCISSAAVIAIHKLKGLKLRLNE